MRNNRLQLIVKGPSESLFVVVSSSGKTKQVTLRLELMPCAGNVDTEKILILDEFVRLAKSCKFKP